MEKVIKQDSNLMDTILTIIEKDPHLWSRRPCASCQTISDIIVKILGVLNFLNEIIN